MLLLANVLGFLVVVVGVVVTAATITDPAWKKRAIVAALVLGAVWIVSNIIVFEQTPGNPRFFTDAANALWTVAYEFLAGRTFQIIGALAAGLVIGNWIKLSARGQRWASRVAATPDSRIWYTGYNILDELADEKLVRDRRTANERLIEMQKEIRPLQQAINQFVPKSVLEAADWENNPKRHPAARQKRTMRGLQEKENAAQRIMDDCFIRMQLDVLQKLQDGILTAKGFLLPTNNDSSEVPIPKERWRFLKFQDGFTKASGEGIIYIGVAVARS